MQLHSCFFYTDRFRSKLFLNRTFSVFNVQHTTLQILVSFTGNMIIKFEHLNNHPLPTFENYQEKNPSIKRTPFDNCDGASNHGALDLKRKTTVICETAPVWHRIVRIEKNKE